MKRRLLGSTTSSLTSWKNSHDRPRRVTMAVIVAAILVIADQGPARHAQSPPGRLLSSPQDNVVLGCNIDGSNCFPMIGGDPTHPVSGAREPSVAANGTIAFNAIWDGTGSCVVGGQNICQRHIFLMDADGRNVRQLTFNPTDASQFGGDNNPSISPEGTMVAFVSNRNAFLDSNQVASHPFEIYVVNTDGSGLREITFPAFDSNGSPHGNMRTVAWSPDGSKLAWSGNVYTTVCGTFFGSPIDVGVVATVNLDGSGTANYVCLGDNGGATAMDWSPDGTLIAYARQSNLGEPAIAFVDFAGNRFPNGLTSSQLGAHCDDSGFHHCFHFSPDSSRLVYENSSFNGLSLINLDGTGRNDAVSLGTAPSRGVWWAAGPAFAAATQFTLAPNPAEVWPGFSDQLVPSLLDVNSQLVFHSAATYSASFDNGVNRCLEIGPFGLAYYVGAGSGTGTISATNEGLTSNSVAFKCWPTPPCTYALGSSSQDFPVGGGADVVAVVTNPGTTGSSCPWYASSNVPWITITSGARGAGSTNAGYTVAVNAGPPRQGTLTVAGQTFTVNQSDAPPASADLAITKVDSPDPVIVGNNLSYTVTATNNGSSGATGVTVTDTLPAGVTFVSASSSQGSCAGTASVTCSIGSLGNGASATVTIVVTPSQTGSLSNTVSVASNESDPNLSNNSATEATTVNPAPQTLSALSPAKLWVGQDDGVKVLKFDLVVEVLVNGVVVGSGQLANVSAGGSDFSQALLDTISLTVNPGTTVPAGAVLSIRPSVRSSCSVRKAGNSGVARLWYNGQPIDAGKPASRDAGSRFDATIGGTNSNYFLRLASALATIPGSARTFVDVPVNDAAACPSRSSTAFGTWSLTIQ